MSLIKRKCYFCSRFQPLLILWLMSNVKITEMQTKKINAVEFLTALVVIDGHTSSYGVRSDCTKAFVDDVCHRAVYYNHAPYEVRFTGVFYLDKRNITSQRPWYPLF